MILSMWSLLNLSLDISKMQHHMCNCYWKHSLYWLWCFHNTSIKVLDNFLSSLDLIMLSMNPILDSSLLFRLKPVCIWTDLQHIDNMKNICNYNTSSKHNDLLTEICILRYLMKCNYWMCITQWELRCRRCWCKLHDWNIFRNMMQGRKVWYLLMQIVVNISLFPQLVDLMCIQHLDHSNLVRYVWLIILYI